MKKRLRSPWFVGSKSDPSVQAEIVCDGYRADILTDVGLVTLSIYPAGHSSVGLLEEQAQQHPNWEEFLLAGKVGGEGGEISGAFFTLYPQSGRHLHGGMVMQPDIKTSLSFFFAPEDVQISKKVFNWFETGRIYRHLLPSLKALKPIPIGFEITRDGRITPSPSAALEARFGG